MFCRHKWETVSVEEYKSPLERLREHGLTRLRSSNFSSSNTLRTKVVHQECTKCGKARLESVQF